MQMHTWAEDFHQQSLPSSQLSWPWSSRSTSPRWDPWRSPIEVCDDLTSPSNNQLLRGSSWPKSVQGLSRPTSPTASLLSAAAQQSNINRLPPGVQTRSGIGVAASEFKLLSSSSAKLDSFTRYLMIFNCMQQLGTGSLNQSTLLHLSDTSRKVFISSSMAHGQMEQTEDVFMKWIH